MDFRFITWNKPRAPTEQELREIFTKEALKPLLVVMNKNETSGVTEQPHDETRIILQGKLQFVANGRAYDLKPGDRLDIPKKTICMTKNLENGQTVVLSAKRGETVYVERY